jgi:ubiquitin C-terminal hydrolase
MDIEDNGEEPQPTKYQLTGIVVHSGQASGGHYYSYILSK